MTHPDPPRAVKIRLMGHPDDVARIAEHLACTLPTAAPPSSPYPNHRDPSTVRVYLEATPR